MTIHFEHIINENDILFHEAYILLSKLFPGGMMPYWVFRNYDVTVALNEQHECIAFALLKFSDDVINDTSIYSSDYDSDSDNSIGTNNINGINDTNDTIDTNDPIDTNNINDTNDTNTCDTNNTNTNDTNNIKKVCDKSMTIVSIGVDKTIQRKGIASAYINWIKTQYPFHSINLHVSIKNTGAIELYKKNGFEIQTTKIKYYSDTGFEPYVGDGIHAHYMNYTVK